MGRLRERRVRGMKQRITQEDLKQLSPEQRGKLGEWWNPDLGELVIIEGMYRVNIIRSISDFIYVEDIKNHTDTFCYNKNELLPLLNISQCIDILYKYDCDNDIISAGAKWSVGCSGHINTESTELIDALWLAVKSIL